MLEEQLEKRRGPSAFAGAAALPEYAGAPAGSTQAFVEEQRQLLELQLERRRQQLGRRQERQSMLIRYTLCLSSALPAHCRRSARCLMCGKKETSQIRMIQQRRETDTVSWLGIG